ncbi:hypothetical protein [Kitasatospora purpeofusca]|uniref:hypothetical protein n=1 Tax=Kitasatospora purpeofusca TaxID=67352 RepID=UPI003862D73F
MTALPFVLVFGAFAYHALLRGGLLTGRTIALGLVGGAVIVVPFVTTALAFGDLVT